MPDVMFGEWSLCRQRVTLAGKRQWCVTAHYFLGVVPMCLASCERVETETPPRASIYCSECKRLNGQRWQAAYPPLEKVDGEASSC